MTHAFRIFLAASLLYSTAACAQNPPAPAPAPRYDIPTLLNLDPARAEEVRAIMKTTHQKMEAVRTQMEAIRKETDLQLAAVLTPEEFQKLQSAMARQQQYRGPPPQQRGPGPQPSPPQFSQPQQIGRAHV